LGGRSTYFLNGGQTPTKKTTWPARDPLQETTTRQQALADISRFLVWFLLESLRGNYFDLLSTSYDLQTQKYIMKPFFVKTMILSTSILSMFFRPGWSLCLIMVFVFIVGVSLFLVGCSMFLVGFSCGAFFVFGPPLRILLQIRNAPYPTYGLALRSRASAGLSDAVSLTTLGGDSA
jgi:hypothetical protein